MCCFSKPGGNPQLPIALRIHPDPETMETPDPPNVTVNPPNSRASKLPGVTHERHPKAEISRILRVNVFFPNGFQTDTLFFGGMTGQPPKTYRKPQFRYLPGSLGFEYKVNHPKIVVTRVSMTLSNYRTIGSKWVTIPLIDLIVL